MNGHVYMTNEWARVYFMLFFLFAVNVVTNIIIAFIIDSFMGVFPLLKVLRSHHLYLRMRTRHILTPLLKYGLLRSYHILTPCLTCLRVVWVEVVRDVDRTECCLSHLFLKFNFCILLCVSVIVFY